MYSTAFGPCSLRLRERREVGQGTGAGPARRQERGPSCARIVATNASRTITVQFLRSFFHLTLQINYGAHRSSITMDYLRRLHSRSRYRQRPAALSSSNSQQSSGGYSGIYHGLSSFRVSCGLLPFLHAPQMFARNSALFKSDLLD